MTDQAAAQKLAFVKEARQLLALFNDPTVITKDRLFIKFIAAGNSDSIQDQRKP